MMKPYRAAAIGLEWIGLASTPEHAARRWAWEYAAEHEFDGVITVTDRQTLNVTLHRVTASMTVDVRGVES